jgi:pimeloyl-ACP methyl ester carboxylesterase
MAFAEPLSSDAAYLSSMPNTIDGPFILVGHSYGGMVITDAANGNQSVKALVCSTAFARDTGRRGRAVVPISPGTVKTNAVAPIRLADGSLQLDKFRSHFAADLPEGKLLVVARCLRTKRAPAEVFDAAWKAIPSWRIFGTRQQQHSR